ncbi:MAG: hypothetical protein AAF517_13580, partial [Planctomycetota bacterium]
MKTLRLLLASALFVVGVSSCSGPPRPSREEFEAGRQAQREGQHRVAIESLDRAIVAAGNASFFYSAALLARGESLLSLSEQVAGSDRIDLLARAYSDFQAVATWQRPTVEAKARALDGQGRVHLERSETAEAETCFLEVLALKHRGNASPDLPSLHHRARRSLGWIRLGQYLSSPKDQNPTSLEAAQEHFFQGLEIDASDALCNLGLGICLHYREQHKVAIPHLKLSIERLSAEENAESDPRPYYYLARAIEESAGYQKTAIDLHTQALENDLDHDFTPLYLHLAGVLSVYRKHAGKPISYYLERLFNYSGRELEYWRKIATLVAQTAKEEKEAEILRLCQFGIALSSRRLGKIDVAASQLLDLRTRGGFEESFNAVFPDGPEATTADAHGRARTLLSLKRNEEFESWMERRWGRRLEDQMASDESAWRTTILQGVNLIQVSRIRNDGTPGGETSRRELLERARRMIQACLAVSEDREARMAMASVLEELALPSEALASYEIQTANGSAD